MPARRSAPSLRKTSGPKRPPLVSVITPTIPGREHLLAECEASVRSQTFTRWEHLVLLDENRDGCSTTMNRLAREAVGEWLLPVADDDFLTPGGIATFLTGAEGADVVYAPPLVWGEDPAQFLRDPPNMPSCALIRRSVWEEVGGYNEELVNREDYDLWGRLMQRRKTFVKVTSGPTRVYRFWQDADGPGNKSRDKPGITDPGSTLG